MDDRLALRISFDGHRSGVTPASAAVDVGWGALVITPPHDAADVDDAGLRDLRGLAAGGVRLVWDGRGTGSWVDVGRARVRALERARLQVRAAADAGADVVVVSCGDGTARQPAEARWDQLAAGLAELAYEAELAGVQVALEVRPTGAVADLDVVDRVVVERQVSAGVRLALDHSDARSAHHVPEAWWPAVAWIRLGVPPPGTWSEEAASITRDAAAAAATFGAAVVESTVWGWDHVDLPRPVHVRRVGSDA